MGSLNIIPTKFVNLVDEKDVEYGFRWWDDENEGYDHTEDWEVPTEPLAFFAFVMENHKKDPFTSIIDYCFDEKLSICIARGYVEWAQWAPVWKKAQELNEVFVTSDGFTLYWEDSKWVDNLDPDEVDLTFADGPNGIPVDANGQPLEGKLY